MKKLPMISVILIAAGLALILYSDPVITSTGTPSGVHTITNGGFPGGNSTTGQSGATLPPGCTLVNGHVQCQETRQVGGGNGETFTLVGTALLAAAIVANVVEAVSMESRGGPAPVA